MNMMNVQYSLLKAFCIVIQYTLTGSANFPATALNYYPLMWTLYAVVSVS